MVADDGAAHVQLRLDLAEGRWARALRHLQRAAEGEARPLMHYLGAARAAHKLGQVEESERLLERALERHIPVST